MILKILIISDTHGQHSYLTAKNLLPQADIIIHAGDFTASYDPELFLNWFRDLPYQEKILIAGNHDGAFEDAPKSYLNLCDSYGIRYLNDSGFTYKGLKIWGSPVQPKFRNWAFNRTRGDDIQVHWSLIPKDTDILITHCPPENILDMNADGINCGCENLKNVVDTIRPVLHVFGHIHEGRGIKVDDTQGKKPITYVNASCLDARYKFYKNPVFLLDWDKLVEGEFHGY